MSQNINQKKEPVTLTLSGNSVIKFLPLSRVRESDGRYYLGREDINIYLHMEEKHAELTRLCNGKRNLREVVEIYAKYNNYPRKKRKSLLREVQHLIAKLIDYQFIQRIDDFQVEKKKKFKKKKIKKKSFILTHLFNLPRLLFIFFLSLIGIAIIIKEPNNFPSPKDMFWYPNLSVSLLTGFLISWLLLYIHELSHLLAARSFSIDGKIYLTRRIVYLVAATKLKNVYKLPQKNRVFIYLAGIASDVFIFSSCLILNYLNDIDFLTYGILFKTFLKQLILISWLKIIWQFQFYMKTDIYIFIKDITGCDKLLYLTKCRVKLSLYKLLIHLYPHYKYKVKDFQFILKSNLYKRAKNILRWYVWFFILGMIFTIMQFILYEIPIAITSFKEGVNKIILGYNSGINDFIFDGITILILQIFYWGMFSYVCIRGSFFTPKRKWDKNITYKLTKNNL